jgi:hypothetical protein
VISVLALRKCSISDAQVQAGWSDLSLNVPGVNLGVIFLAFYLVAPVTTYAPLAVRASRVYPAEALRSPMSTRCGCSV